MSTFILDLRDRSELVRHLFRKDWDSPISDIHATSFRDREMIQRIRNVIIIDENRLRVVKGIVPDYLSVWEDRRSINDGVKTERYSSSQLLTSNVPKADTGEINEQSR